MLFVVLGQSPASADRAIEEGWVEPFPVSSTIDVLSSFLVSGDLRTAVHSGCAPEPDLDGADGVTFIDLATGIGTTVTGTPNNGCADDFVEFGPVEPPFATSVQAVTHDGSALVSTSWEGIEAGDEDGGARDVVLVDRSTGQPTLLSGGSGDVEAFPIDVSGDGSVAIFRTYSATSDPTSQFHVWRDGVVSDLIIPDEVAAAFEFGGNKFRLSEDGRYLLAVSNALVARLDTATGTAITTPYTGTCCGLAAVAISSDGQFVAWAGQGGLFETNLFGPLLHMWDMSTVQTFNIAGITDPMGTHDQLFFSDDSSQLLGASRVFDNEDYSGGHIVWAFNRTTSTFRVVVDERPYGAYWLRIKELSADGNQAVISTMGPVGYEAADPRMIYGGRVATRQYLWDAALTPPPRPGADPTVANQIERLYMAFLRRPSDDLGRQFWIEKRLEGTTLGQIGDAFASSTEFSNTYGALDSETFIDLVYANVLGRSPDTEGRNYWLGQLGSGVSRGQVMTLFSESTEFIRTSNTSVPLTADEAALRRLYSAYFLRDPDRAGIDYWLSQVRAGVSLRQVSDAFAQSNEFSRNYGDLDNIQFMRAAYLNIFGRYPEPEGFDYWKRELEAGTLRGDLMLALASSPEMLRHTTAGRP